MEDGTAAQRCDGTDTPLTGRLPSAPADTPDATEPTTPSFRGQFRRSVRAVDLAAIVLVPVVLVAVALLPSDARLSLAFSYDEPTIRSAFTATFVHIGIEHLLYNVAMYVLVVPVVYTLSVMAGDRDRFYVAFVAFLLVFPVVLSLSNLALPRDGVGLGFSGVNMAFVGYLPVALAGYLRATFDVRAERAIAAALFFVGLALVALLTVRLTLTVAVAGVAGLAAVGNLLAADVGLPSSRPALGRSGDAELVVVAVFLLAGGLVAAFPPDLTMNGAIVNVYVHLLGYALGFIATTITLRTAPLIERQPSIATVRVHAVAALCGLTARASA